MKNTFAIFATALLVGETWARPVNSAGDSIDWYTDSAAGVVESLEDAKRDKTTNWYTDSAAGVAESLSRTERDEGTNWYADSASGVAESLANDRRDKSANWYTDSAAGVAESLSKAKRDEESNWYADSASGVAASLAESKRDESTDWYTDSAAGISESLAKNKREKQTDWYTDSAAGIAESLSNTPRDAATNWYADSAAGVANSLVDKRTKAEDNTDWYSDSSAEMVEALNKRSMTYKEKENYEKTLRDWIYEDMRRKPLRESSERGKAFFEFTPKPRNDVVDRWHVPAELQERFDATDSDAERVSMLNYYLMVTGRDPKPASELGFTPTFDKPGLTETNEVGYGYALAGQHQSHCTNFVSDAIDIGKDNLNDFFLKHTIHCLGLLKYLAPQLTMKQPTSFLLAEANTRVANNYPQTIDIANIRD
ncbi:hypothetical protein GGR57DRAFT_514060 [Xylariaceae sp. FL1272]|nr:hypothetical protein GGR57DRAFT_514060 [Xylariaceae sp. FL1272]